MWKRVVLIVAGVLILAAVLFGSRLRHEPPRVSGFLETREIRLGSRVGGRVARVLVREGDRVEGGQVLVELEPFDLLAREQLARAELAARQSEHARFSSGFRPQELAQARAQVDGLSARLARLVNGPRSAELVAARAQVDVAKAQLLLAQQSFDRARELAANKTIPAAELDRAIEELQAAKGMHVAREQELAILEEGSRKEDVAAARAELEGARAALELMEAGYREEDIASARASVDAAGAALAIILAQKEELRIAAPTAGVIESLDLEPGDLAGPGAPVVSMSVAGEIWVRAYLPERLGLALGQQVRVTVDAYSEEFAGEVTFISSRAEFTPSNVQTPEERSKQVFRIKVTLQDGLDRLRAGMSADVWLPEQGDAR